MSASLRNRSSGERGRSPGRMAAALGLAILSGVPFAGCDSSRCQGGGVGASVDVLNQEVDRALAGLERVEGGDEGVDEARRSLLRIRDFYLPVLEVQQKAHRARDSILAGEWQRAAATLADLELSLIELGSADIPGLSRESEILLRHVASARVAVGAGHASAVSDLDQLGARIDLLLLKGDLVLREPARPR